MREAHTAGDETHDVVNLTDVEIVVDSYITKTKTVVPPGATVAVNLPPGATISHNDSNSAGGIRSVKQEYADMTALAALTLGSTSTNSLANITLGDWGSVTGVPVGTAPASLCFVCTGGKVPARVSLTITEGKMRKLIQVRIVHYGAFVCY